jgi:hypothetical protein
MTDRHTIDTINSDQLDQLYDERDRLAAQLAAQRIPQFTARPVDPETERAATERARQLATEAEHAAAHLATIGAPDGLVIEPYRNDRHDNVWVFRCWGTDDCDGYLSLDHSSQQSAERARDRHVAEDHTAEQPARTTPNNPPTSKDK